MALAYLIGAIVPLALVGGAIFGFVAWRRSRGLSAEVRALREDVAALRRELGLRLGSAGRTEPDEAEPEPAESRAGAPEPAESRVEEPEPQPQPDEPEARGRDAAGWARPASPAAAKADPEARRQEVEEALTSRWLVWGGSVAIAAGGYFLVKFSIEQGLLGPGVRVSLGAVLGILLVAGGEWLRRRPFERAIAAIHPSYVPPALTAAGVSILFTSIYAAYALYDLISATSAFVLLSAVAAGAVLLALLQGPLVAVVGIVGGYLIPGLVSTGEHRPEILFPYLLVLTAGSLVVVRFVARWWLAWLALAGAALWPVLWFAVSWLPGDAWFAGPYLLATGALFILVRFRSAPSDTQSPLPNPFLIADFAPPERIAACAAAAVGILLFVLVRIDGYGAVSVVSAAIGIAAALAAARREPDFDALAVVAAVLAVAIVACWHHPEFIAHEPAWLREARQLGHVTNPIVPPELTPFLGLSAAYALIVGGGAFAALWNARRPALWGSVAGATPVVVYAVAYWRIEGFSIAPIWTAAGLALVLILALAADRVRRHREAPGMNGALGAFAVATVAALSLTMTTAFENAWLTVALAVELPAIAWIASRLELPALRRLALVLAGIVLVRLILNYRVLDYPMVGYPGLNWLLYGYAVPAAAFFAAARVFRRKADDTLVTLLEAGAVAFTVLFFSLEVRHLMSDGRIDAPEYGFAERSLQTIVWLAVGYILYARQPPVGWLVRKWGARLLVGLALGQVIALQLLADNPIFSRIPVGTWPVFNLLLLGYLVPGVFAVLFMRAAHRHGHGRVERAAGFLALFLGFVWLSFEIRHAFHGSVLVGASTNAELYAYSVGWLAYAGFLLALALWRGYAAPRYGSLVVVLLTAAKVVVFDVAWLTGVWRALSFLGLGLALVGVSYLYRRFVFPPRAPRADPSDEPPAGRAQA